MVFTAYSGESLFKDVKLKCINYVTENFLWFPRYVISHMDKGSLIATLIFLISFSKIFRLLYKEQKSQEREVPPVLVYRHPDSVFPCLGFTAAISQHGLCIKQAKDNRNTPN